MRVAKTIHMAWRCLGLRPRLLLFMVLVAAVPVLFISIFAFRTGSQGIRRHT